MTEEVAESLQRIHMLLQTGRCEEGAAEAGRLLGEYPDSAAAWRLRAVCHLELHRFPEAHGDASQCLRLDPGDTTALNVLGQSLLLGGHTNEALRVFNDLVARKPDEGVHHLLAAKALARLHLSIGMRNPQSLNTVHDALNRAATLDPDRVSTHSQAGDVYRSLQLLEHAETAYRRALELDPQYEDAVRGLSALSAMRGRLRGAADHGALLMALNPRAQGASRIMYAGILRIGLRVNHYATVVTPFCLLTGALATHEEASARIFGAVFTLVLVALPSWHLARILAVPANVRSYLSGFQGFRGWMAGLVLMPVSLLVLGLAPLPWGLYGLALLLAAYLWQRYGRNRMLADVAAREDANARASAR
ncbi:tetratricopeptide repeat protein [Nocardiopsis deserti]|uniref:tetratricopeptide repeat protein n=1 Tax=Nocardiopsis deserti TaxID=2605988 RepID=UPI00123C2A1B|nr:tetratricopeptide repeat protein [Nocardiopsis deserti]